MSRWKPPGPKASPYITLQGYQTLELELKERWQKRKGVVSALSAAAAEGDRSENAEYIYRKKELRGIDSRIHYLQKRLPALTIVSEKPGDIERIFFGAHVTLENQDGATVTYHIVGPDELNPKKNTISIDSPLALALLRKSIDDEVLIQNAVMENRYRVLDIEYA